MSRPIQLPDPKKCSCGAVHMEIPADHKTTVEGNALCYWWDCGCKSTLFAQFGTIVGYRPKETV